MAACLCMEPITQQREYETPQHEATYSRRQHRKIASLMPLCNCCRAQPDSIRMSSGQSNNQTTSKSKEASGRWPKSATETHLPVGNDIKKENKSGRTNSAITFQRQKDGPPMSTPAAKSVDSSADTPDTTAPDTTAQNSPVADLITQVAPPSFDPSFPIMVPTKNALYSDGMILKSLVAEDPKNQKPLLGCQCAKDKGKKTLVLDLDETLVHSAFKPVSCYAFQINVDIEGQVHKIYVSKRPGVDEFLLKVAELYEIVVFTASLDKYANPVIDLIDPLQTCQWRLFRESCTQIFMPSLGTLNYVKDLSRLGRDMRHVIIVDNSPYAYSLQPENAIPIRSWFDDRDDRELFELVPILRELAKVDDVPFVMRQALPVSDEGQFTVGA